MKKCFFDKCNKLTNNPKFCSRSCAAKHNNKTPKRKKKLKKCKNCTSIAEYGSLFCSVCKRKPYRTLADVLYKKHHKASAFALVRNNARACMKNKPQICRHCGYDKHVEVCHIKPIASFEPNALLSEINSYDNLILLCPNCHWEFDKGLFKI